MWMRLSVRVLFYPTLWWNRLLNGLDPQRHWWDWIDDAVLLGALPGKRDVPALKDLGIAAVVNTCEEYPGPLGAYRKHGIEQLYLPTVDYTPPTLEHIRQGVAFIHERVNAGKKVYVHCKAGRGRSATIVACYLISKGWSAEEAQDLLIQKRPQVLATIYQREVVQSFARECSAGVPFHK
jgi:atypical dual specificity phosphatase